VVSSRSDGWSDGWNAAVQLESLCGHSCITESETTTIVYVLTSSYYSMSMSDPMSM
jgi:hypothetical protein